MWDCVQVKEETAWAWEGVSAEAAAAGLYAQHEVKQELVVGPDVLQPPDVAIKLKPNFKVTVVKEELNYEESDGAEAGNGDSNQTEKCLEDKCQFSNGRNQLLLRTCTVWLERIILDKELLSNNNNNNAFKLKDSETHCCNVVEDINEINLWKKMQVATREGPFTCDSCDLLFTHRKKIKKHLQTCLRQVSKPSKKITKIHSCKICYKQFHKRVNLTKHQKIHTKEKQYNCEVCGKRFYQSSHLYRHQHTHKPKVTVTETYPCEICNKRYVSKYALRTHLRVHTGQMPYICNCCGKRFNIKSSLVKHENIHAENRPYYSCEVCDRQYAEKWNLTKHKRSHANEYPYPCDLCGKKYMHSYSLTKHKRKKHL